LSADQPVVLREAHSIVAEQLARLRVLAESTRRDGERLSVALRQAERQVDEVTMQHRMALQRGASSAPELGRRLGDLRTRYDVLARETHANQHALKQLEQLVRQIEMSSGALTDDADGDASDPWLLALRAQVIHGREEERMRLAREVHDGPAQVLANSLMILETCYTLAQQTESERLVTMLDRLREGTREGLLEVRRFIANLRPGALDEQGLITAIAEYVRGYVNAYDARVSLEADPLPRLPNEVEIVLYRIVQEALQNVHKYARGAAVAIRIARQGQRLAMSIRDDGPGFDPHEVARRAGRSSWGLTSMRERAELVGARFGVVSGPGQGTEVIVILPLD
jgi:two-component system, NarL family, sensor histidine kinase DegS